MIHHGIQKKPDQLSRATAEQLFLALRFGYMTNQAENSEVPPVNMDDILVNFDANRSGYTANAILELAGTPSDSLLYLPSGDNICIQGTGQKHPCLSDQTRAIRGNLKRGQPLKGKSREKISQQFTTSPSDGKATEL